MKKLLMTVVTLTVLVASAFSCTYKYNGVEYTEDEYEAFIEQFDEETQYLIDAKTETIWTEQEELELEISSVLQDIKCAAAEIDYLRHVGVYDEELMKSWQEYHSQKVDDYWDLQDKYNKLYGGLKW